MRITERSGIAAAALLLTFGLPAAVNVFAEGTGNEKVTAKDVSKYTASQINADMGLGLTIALPADSTAAPAAFEQGFDTVRFTGDWTEHISDDGKFTVDEEWISEIKTAVDAAAAKDMYIVLSLDSENSTAKETKAVWAQLTEAFAAYDRKLVFEGDFFIKDDKPADNDNKSVIETVRAAKGGKDRILMAEPVQQWSTVGFDSNMIAEISGSIFDVKDKSFTDKTAKQIEDKFAAVGIGFVGEGVPACIVGAAESSFAKADENTKWAECYGSSAKKTGVSAVFDKLGDKQTDTAAAKLFNSYSDTSQGSMLEYDKDEDNTKLGSTGYITLTSGKGSIKIADLLGDTEREDVKCVRMTACGAFKVDGTDADSALKQVVSLDDIKGDSIDIISAEGSTATWVKYDILTKVSTIQPDIAYLQFTEPDDSGMCSVRAVKMVKYDDASTANSVKFTFDLNGQKAVVNSGKFYRAVSAQGELIEPDDDYVFVAAVITGIPEDTAKSLSITDIELVFNEPDED